MPRGNGATTTTGSSGTTSAGDAGSGGAGGAGGTGGSATTGTAGSGAGCANPSMGDLLAVDEDAAGGLAIDDGWVYWRRATTAPGATDAAVLRVPLDGGCPEEVMKGLGGPPAFGAPIAVAGGQVYAFDKAAEAIVHAPATGGAPTPLYTGVSDLLELAADADALYFAVPGEGTVVRAPLDGSGLQELATGQKSPLGVAVDATHVYFACDGDPGGGFTDGSLARVGKAVGSPVEVLESPVAGAQDVAVSGSTVFFLQPTPWRASLRPRGRERG